MCGNRRTCLGRVRSGRVGPGTEPRGTPTPKAWAEEEENQGRQCCDARRVAVGGQWEDLRPQCGFTLERVRAAEGQRDPEKGMVGAVRSCCLRGSGIRGHSLRQERVWRGQPVGAGAFE